MEDVAERAGVSRALVSIVVRGVAGASESTRARVMAAAEEVGYRPDSRARLLASGRSRQIGVVFLAAGRFHHELLDGIYRAADSVGYEVILSALTPSRDEARAVQSLLDFRCEGIIQLGPEVAKPAVAGRVPVVVVGWHVADPAVDVVRTSDGAGMRQAVDHLVELGHRDIVHVDGGDGVIAAGRRRAFAAAAKRHGLAGEVVTGGHVLHDGLSAARRLLQRDRLPDAVIAFNDDVAAAVVETLAHAGIQVPQDLSVVGWDDTEVAGLPHLDLTTVRQDAVKLAELAVQRSVANLNGERPTDRTQVLRPQLIVRGSTRPVCAPGTDVATGPGR